jgi:RNA polymerase sigma factor (sigma-70 family)
MTIKENKTVPLSLMISESIKNNQKMQKMLYDQFAAKMYSVCLRYAKNPADAEDILQEGFIKVFGSLSKFRGEGSFEGWVRRIVIRTALNHLRDNKREMYPLPVTQTFKYKETSAFDKLAEKDLVGIVKTLPHGCQTIFTMYVIEGYNHREIAGMLGCSESNCKTQLYRSKTRLQQILKQSA